MKEVVKKLAEEQVAFIESEFGISRAELEAMSEDDLYDRVYDPACVIEEVETVATIDDDSDLSERGKIASELVTVLGNAIEETGEEGVRAAG